MDNLGKDFGLDALILHAHYSNIWLELKFGRPSFDVES